MTHERACGDCSLCCLLLHVPEVQKPVDGWCRHCRPGKGGCSIYDRRPPVCRNWTCLWLAGSLPDYWAPLQSKLVLDRNPGESLVRVFVHPEHPDRWREKPYHGELRALARTGLMGTTEETFHLTIVVDRKCGHVVLPHRDVPCDQVLQLAEILSIGRGIFYRQRLNLSLEKEFEHCLRVEVMIAQHYSELDEDAGRRLPPFWDDDDHMSSTTSKIKF